MAVEWEISEDTHGRVVTCQRPILLGFSSEFIGVDHFRIMLEIKDTSVPSDDENMIDYNGGWLDTGIRINAYSDDGGEFYQANLASYVRNYFQLSKLWLKQTFISMNWEQTDWLHMFRREFRARVWPVVFDVSGTLIEETSNFKYISEFMVFDTNIKSNEQSSSLLYDNIRMDNFITGNCNGSQNSNTYGMIPCMSETFTKMLTNMPGALRVLESPTERLVTLNVNDGIFPRVGVGVCFRDNLRYRFVYTKTNLDGTETDISWYQDGYGTPYAWTDTNNVDILWYDLDLRLLDLVLMVTGIATNAFFDSNGYPNCTKISIQSSFYTASGLERRGPVFTCNVTDKKNDGKCNRTRFIFKNMRGGMDWFSCYGESERSVEIIGSHYTTQQKVSRGGTKFVEYPGQHSVSNLWNTRKEKYKVITQPVSSEWAEWLEELITSPMVWVEEVDKNVRHASFSTGDPDKQYEYQNDKNWRRHQRLVPIVIDKNTFTIHNTEENVNYIEFTYTKSYEDTTSKAY